MAGFVNKFVFKYLFERQDKSRYHEFITLDEIENSHVVTHILGKMERIIERVLVHSPSPKKKG